MKATACALLLLALAASVIEAQPNAAKPNAAKSNTASITIQFDNRGSKVMSSSTSKAIVDALAKTVFMVPASQVKMVGGLGQSSLTNHQAIVTYTATGPTTNGKSPLDNCKAAIRPGLLTSSAAKKAIKKATDSWLPGDSAKLEKATCK